MAGDDVLVGPARGTVREFDQEQGFGAIDSDETPGGCWVHYSAVLMPGYRYLDPGEDVLFRYTVGGQDGFGFRAEEVWRPSESYEEALERSRPDPTISPGAYTSSLEITYPDDGIR